MSSIGGQEFTNFRNLRVRGSGTSTTTSGAPGPAAIRLVATNALESTLSVNTTYQDSNYQWTLPAKTGLIGVSGTFTVNLPAINAGSYAETAVVVSGLRAEDGLVCSMMNNSYETVVTTNRGFIMLGQARPSATGIDMVFLNPTATATVVESPIIAYTAFR